MLYPPPGDLPNPGIKSHMSPALTSKFLITSVTWEDPKQTNNSNNTFKKKDASISGLPGDPVVKIPCFHCRGCRFHGSGWGHKKKKKERKKRCLHLATTYPGKKKPQNAAQNTGTLLGNLRKGKPPAQEELPWDASLHLGRRDPKAGERGQGGQTEGQQLGDQALPL